MRMSNALSLRSVAVTLACLSAAGCSDEEETLPPSRTGVMEIVLPGNDFFPEGIAAAADNTFYIGSVMTGQIIQVKPGSDKAEDFVAPKAIVSGVVGLHVQRDQKYLWLCSNVYGTTDAPQLIAVDRQTAQAVHRHTFPAEGSAGSGFCNEIAEDSAGNLYASDSVLGRIIRVKADKRETDESAEVFIRDPTLAPEPGQFGLNGLAYDGQASLYAVKTVEGTLFRIPITAAGAAGALQAIPLDKPLLGADGLQYVNGRGLIVAEQYGKAVSHIALADNRGTVTRLQEGLDDPSSLVVAEESIWVSEGQLSAITVPNAPPAKLPFKVRRVSLPK
jgi:sugar lactone lactonase YvrE